MKIEFTNPKRHILGSKHVYEAYIGDDASAGATCGRAKYNKKKETERDTHNSGKLAIRPDHSCRRIKIKLCVLCGLTSWRCKISIPTFEWWNFNIKVGYQQIWILDIYKPIAYSRQLASFRLPSCRSRAAAAATRASMWPAWKNFDVVRFIASGGTLSVVYIVCSVLDPELFTLYVADRVTQ